MTIIDPKTLDCANHRADATEADIKKLCQIVLHYGFNSAFVNPVHVPFAKSCIGEKAKVGTVISFPLGQDSKDVKIHALRECIRGGADELDIVPDISKIKEKNLPLFSHEVREITSSARAMRKDIIVKFIIETGLFLPEHFLSVEETPDIQLGKLFVHQAAVAIRDSGSDFIKICSGLSKRGVSVDDVTYIRSIVGPTIRIKGAGGIDTKAKALELLKAGANRLGTSHAPDIMSEI